MSDSPFHDAVAIDTNVFIHLLNPQENVDSHINNLLKDLQMLQVNLIVDESSRIQREYRNQIEPIIRKSDDIRDEIYILRYWLLQCPRLTTELVLNDALMTAIKGVIVELDQNVDRILVYVALRQGKALISNDRMNIVVGPPSESSERRQRLLRSTQRFRTGDADILTSLEAHARIQA